MGVVVSGGSCVYSAAERSVMDVVAVISVNVMSSVVVSVGLRRWIVGINDRSDWTSCVGSVFRRVVHSEAVWRTSL